MKRNIVAIMVMTVVVLTAGCSSKDTGIVVNPDGSSESSSESSASSSAAGTDTSADLSLEDASDEDVAARKQVTSADGSYTASIIYPMEFTYSEYSSDTVCTYDSVDGTTSYTFMVLDLSAEEAESQMYSEVQYIAGANASGEIHIDTEASEKDVDGYKIHYFLYDYSGLKGARIWTEVASGEVLTCTAENYYDNSGEIADLDIDEIINDYIVTAK